LLKVIGIKKIKEDPSDKVKLVLEKNYRFVLEVSKEDKECVINTKSI